MIGTKKVFGRILAVAIVCLSVVHFGLNNPGAWGNYENCLKVQAEMTEAQVFEIMGPPEMSEEALEDQYFDRWVFYDRYAFNSSSGIRIKFVSRAGTMRVIDPHCEDSG